MGTVMSAFAGGVDDPDMAADGRCSHTGEYMPAHCTPVPLVFSEARWPFHVRTTRQATRVDAPETVVGRRDDVSVPTDEGQMAVSDGVRIAYRFGSNRMMIAGGTEQGGDVGDGVGAAFIHRHYITLGEGANDAVRPRMAYATTSSPFVDVDVTGDENDRTTRPTLVITRHRNVDACVSLFTCSDTVRW